MRKKLLALLLAAALALSLLAGCGGGESVASALLKLLDGRYPNISIEIDPELEADLRQAIRKAEAENAGDDAAVIRAALEKLVGFTVTFRKLGEGQQGDTTFDLVFYSGTDPDKAAQAAYSQWHPILSNVPDDGQYDTSLAMVETNSGVWMLVKATVEKAGTVDKPDKDDDEPEPEKPKDPYTKNADGNYTVNTKDGLQKLYNDLKGTSDFATAKITLNSPVTLDDAWPENITFTGELNGNNHKITMTGTRTQGLFNEIGANGKVLNVDIEVNGTITATVNRAGAIADENYGSISNCTVTIQDSGSITATVNAPTAIAYAGGIVGYNEIGGSISNCTVTVNGFITATTTTTSYDRAGSDAHAGGIAGYNVGTIDKDCSVKLNAGTIQATATGTEDKRTHAYAGGIAGITIIDGVECGQATGTGTIKATVTGTSSSSDGSVTLTLNSNTVTVDPESAKEVGNTYVFGTARAGTKTA